MSEKAAKVHLTVTHRGKPQGPLLVLLHGISDDASCWGEPVKKWGTAWHVAAPDLRGHGRSPRTTAKQCEDVMATMQADVLKLLDDLHEPVVLVGHSLGGRLALVAATERPEQVRGLVLEDPAIGVDEDSNPVVGDDFWAFVRSVADDPEMARRRQLLASSWSPAEVETWAASKAQVDELTLRRIRFEPIDSPGLLNQLACPTLVVAPSDSRFVPRPDEVTNEKVTFHLLEGVGHCVHRDDPTRYHALVDPFLAKLAKVRR